MKQFIVLITALVALSIGGFLFYKDRKNKTFKLNISPEAISVEEIDGVVKLVEIVNRFKSLELDSKNETPFIVQGTRMHELISSFKRDSLETSVFIGVYNEVSNEISFYMLIVGKAFDKKLSDVLSKATKDNPIIVLN